jgi:B-cell receptor-associated protein 31
VFLLLVFEMAVFLALVIPLPHTIKRKLFAFISESPIIAKLQYGLKVYCQFETPNFRSYY